MESTRHRDEDGPPDFVLSFAGETDDVQLRSCWVRGRLRDRLRDDHMLVEIDPPVVVRRGPGLIGYRDITQLILSPRHQGYGLFPVVAWPTFVFVARILDESILQAMEFEPRHVSPLLWGTIYESEKMALEERAQPLPMRKP